MKLPYVYDLRDLHLHGDLGPEMNKGNCGGYNGPDREVQAPSKRINKGGAARHRRASFWNNFKPRGVGK